MGVLAPVLAVLMGCSTSRGRPAARHRRPRPRPSKPRLAFIKAFAAPAGERAGGGGWCSPTRAGGGAGGVEPPDQPADARDRIHRRTDEPCSRAKQAAELANQAKSRYITAISHELRTPLNSILGYAQILDGDDAIPPTGGRPSTSSGAAATTCCR